MQIHDFSVEKKSAAMVLTKAKYFGPVKSTNFSTVLPTNTRLYL
jgi:hypothetical protein